MTSRPDAARRVISLAAAVLVHALLLFGTAGTVKTPERLSASAGTYTGVMKITDIREELPRVPPASSPSPAVENTAETIIAAETMPAANKPVSGSGGNESDFLPAHLVSQLPRFSADELKKRVRYPSMAQRAGIEGTVYLEIFVDRKGEVRNVSVLKEEPEGRGFGGAAAAAFLGFKGSPALVNGKETAVRYRYPVRFSLR